jgi:hypothetical protein
MDLTKPAVLLVGGGEGMGPVEKTVDGVAKVNITALMMGGLLCLYSQPCFHSSGWAEAVGLRMCYSVLSVPA